MKAEEWRVVARNPNYEVSSLGRVRRATPYRSTKAGHILTPFPHRDGHLLVKLSACGKAKNAHVHSLVCEAFHGLRPSPDHEVAHGDGRPGNNAYDNLRWATRQENAVDAIAHGTIASGSRNGNSSLREDQIPAIRQMLAAGTSAAVIARGFGVSRAAISNIKHNHTWRHIQ